MKKLKTLCVAFGLLVCSSAVFAQGSDLSLALRGGVNLSNAHVDKGIKSDMRVGYNFGLVAEYPFAESVFLQTGLSVTSKGAKIKSEFSDEDWGNTKSKLSMNAVYLELPIMVGYRMPVTESFKMNFTFGPYVALGVGGKAKYSERASGEYYSEKYKTFGDDILRRFDMGLGAGVGAEYDNLLFNIGYQFGLLNVAKDGTYRSRNAFVTVGYRIM